MRLSRAQLLLLAVLAAPACAGRGAAHAVTDVVVDPEAPSVTPHADLLLLKQKAAMGRVGDVRAELAPRLATAADGVPDPGRDALRALAIELALVQGDREAASRELAALAQDLDRLGAGASSEARARWVMLQEACLFEQERFGEARSSSLQALALLDEAPATPLTGSALRGLARDQLALGDPEKAVATLRRALEIHGASATETRHLDLHEDLLLAVDIMIALNQPQEAVIAAGQLYDEAIPNFGPDTLAHAEALVAAGAATLASGDLEASRTFVEDARAIFDQLQAERSDPRFPVSVRLERRLQGVDTALRRAPRM